MLILAINKTTWAHVQKRCVGSTYPQSKRFSLFLEPDLPCITTTHYPIIGKKTRDFDGIRVWVVPLPASLHPHFYSLCPSCYGDDLRVTSRGQKICSACGAVVDDQVDASTSYTESYGAPSIILAPYKQALPRRHSTQNINKRVNHFKYWLARLQGKQAPSRITGDTIKTISRRLQDRHVTHPECGDVKQVLKELGLQRLYIHTHFILYSVTGEPLLRLDAEHEHQLVSMFRSIQGPFAQHSSRVNMLSYPYIIRKLFELLGWDDAAALIPHLKSAEKVRNQDVVWRQICLELGWPFHRSVA